MSPDRDGDGTLDEHDNCPFTRNPGQEDSDGDGVGDACSSNIDIKPGSDPNTINCNNDQEVITVAILTTATFDATTVDHTKVTFEGAAEIHVNRRSPEGLRHEEDVDDDGDTDLVFHFRRADTALTCDSTEGTLAGETFFAGTDSINMVEGTTIITAGEPIP